MRIWAALDLRAGRVVQLVGGRPDRERVSLPDPATIAHTWVSQGFSALHVIDLDAALGNGDNRAAILGILEAVRVPVQVGGGLRDDAAVCEMLDAGARHAIVGTRAIEDRRWLESLVDRYPGRIVVAADFRDDRIVTHGWTGIGAMEGEAFLKGLDGLELAGVLATDVSREGSMSGIDEARFSSLVHACSHPLTAAGGIAGLEDLRALERTGAAGAVLGMSLYTGAVTAEMVTREFAA